EENELVGLLRAYSDSSLAQIRSLVATSAVIVQDVAYVRGLKGDRPDSTYAFAPFTETVVRHSREAQPADSTDDSADGFPASAGDCTTTQVLTWAEALAQAEAEIVADRDCASGRKKDRAAGRRQRRIRKRAQEIIDNPPPPAGLSRRRPPADLFHLAARQHRSQRGRRTLEPARSHDQHVAEAPDVVDDAGAWPAAVPAPLRRRRFHDRDVQTLARAQDRDDAAARGHPAERRPPPPGRHQHRRRLNCLSHPDWARSRASGVLQASRSIRSGRVQGQYQCVLRPVEDRRL